MYDGFIYETTCTVSGMKYRGRHERSHIDPVDPDDSWYIGSPTNPQFWEDLEKYGRESFIREILDSGPFNEKLEGMKQETRRLKEVDAANNPQYYNRSNWGGTEDQLGDNNPMYGKKGTLHHGYGIPRSEDTRKKISKNHADVSGKNNPMYGKPHPNTGKHFIHIISEEGLESMSKSSKERATNSRWYNNGVEERFIRVAYEDEYISKGYKPGRLYHKREKVNV